MSIETLLQAITESELGMAISMNGYAFPWLETLHVFALATVFGSIALVDTRLIGFGSHRRSASKLIKELLPFTWVGFVCAVITGSLLFTSNPYSYAESIPFLTKMGLIVLAGINMMIFHFGAYRQIDGWDNDSTPPVSVRLSGAISLCLWVIVLFYGRWIGFAAPFI